MQPGRPRFLDEPKRREIIALFSQGCSVATAAQYVGCTPRTILREFNRNKEFNEQVRNTRVSCQLAPLNSISSAARSNWRAAAWRLERIAPRDFLRRNPKHIDPREAQEAVHEIWDQVGKSIRNPQLRRRFSAASSSTSKPPNMKSAIPTAVPDIPDHASATNSL